MRAAAKIILSMEDLPRSSDPRILAKSLYKLMDPEATKGFKVLVMIYNHMDPQSELPPELKKDPAKLLTAINAIIHLQNNDPDYRWPSPLHQARFGKRR